MNLINRIISDLREFVEFFIIKYKYDQRGILKRFQLKSGLNKHLNEDLWCDLFLEKAAYNYCAKFLLIKLLEDTNKIACKLNKEGLQKWRQLVSNIESRYGMLYEIAEADILEAEYIREVFKRTDYDIYEIDDELAEFIIEKLKEYDFKTFNSQTILQIFANIYKNDKKSGINLQYFYKPANAIDYILSVKEHEENLVQ